MGQTIETSIKHEYGRGYRIESSKTTSLNSGEYYHDYRTAQYQQSNFFDGEMREKIRRRSSTSIGGKGIHIL